MPYRRYTSDPWQRMARMVEEMNRAFQGWPAVPAGMPAFPRLNGWYNEDGLVLTAELPGVDPDQLELNVHNDTLTISGEKAARERDEDTICHRRERFAGSFSREITLPYPVDPDQVQAAYKNGLLTVTLQRAEEAKPRRIAVKNA